MGMTTHDFYSMLPKAFAAKVKGYSNKIYRKSSEFRRAAFIIISPHIDKRLSFEKFCNDFWKLEGDEEYKRQIEVENDEDTVSLPTADKDLWAEIKKQQNLKEKAKEFEDIMRDHNLQLSAQRRANK